MTRDISKEPIGKTRVCGLAASRMRTERGFTLVEIMVAVTIGLIILAAVAQLFATSRTAFVLEEGLARLQENGRFSMEFIVRDLRMAGYAGCLNVSQALNTKANYTVTNQLQTVGFGANFGAGQHLQGFSANAATWTPALPGIFGGNPPLPDTDVLVVRRGDDTAYRLTAAMGGTAANVPITGHSLGQNEIVIVADCNNVDIFQITADPTGGALPHDASANNSVDLSKDFGTQAEVMRLLTRVYYVGTGAAGSPALMRSDMDPGGGMAAAVELVEDVESMRIVYGEDTDADGDANIYRLPGAVTDWSRVVGVRIGLLLRTPNESGQDVDAKVYDVLGDTAANTDNFDPVDDKRQRRIFSSTIRLRNMRTD
ncbi:MAG: PilW family protein [Alphaproteobacteria bacterium]